MYCCRFGVLLNAHFVSSTIAWSIKLIGKFIPKDKYSLCPFISGVLTYSPLPVGGIEIQQIILLPFVNLNSLPFASGLNPASLVCLSSSLLVDKRSTSTTNLKQPPEAGMSKRLSSSSATLLKSPDKRKSPRLPPSPPSSLLPSYPVLQLNQQKCFVFVCVCVRIFMNELFQVLYHFWNGTNWMNSDPSPFSYPGFNRLTDAERHW